MEKEFDMKDMKYKAPVKKTGNNSVPNTMKLPNLKSTSGTTVHKPSSVKAALKSK
jgi:hypothetical protein